jgi:hypothetical protein
VGLPFAEGKKVGLSRELLSEIYCNWFDAPLGLLNMNVNIWEEETWFQGSLEFHCLLEKFDLGKPRGNEDVTITCSRPDDRKKGLN